LRFSTLGSQSFDGDELLQAWLSGLSFPDLLSTIPKTDKLPYLYHVLAWGWAQLVGNGEFALRFPSAVAGTLTVPVAGVAGSLIASRRVGLVAALLVAVNPLMVWYSQQARAYALVGLFGALSFLFFVQALRSPGVRALALWSLFSALAVATQYFAGFLVAMEATWLFLTFRGGPGKEASGWVLRAAAGPVVVAAAHLPLAVAQLDAGAPGQIEDVALPTRLAQLPKVFLVGYSAPEELVVSLVAAGLAVIALSALGYTREQERKGATTTAVVVAGTIGAPVLLALVGIDYLAARYLITGLVPAAIGLACSAVVARRATLAVALLCVLFLTVVVSVAATRRLQRTDWRGAARALGSVRTDRALVVSPGTHPGAIAVYFKHARRLPPGGQRVREIAVLGLATEGTFTAGTPKPPRPPSPPAPPGFRLIRREESSTFTLLRYRARTPRSVNAFKLVPLTLDKGVDRGFWLQRSQSVPGPTR